ncbi:MAG: LacI family DNA-binding transcriptional regulator [Granulosicoccaceae bacterium]
MNRVRSRKGAPGIVEVAIRAGVSPATVSRFYNSPDKVRPGTRHRIEQSARDLGYIRDRMAGSMHSRFSGTIGLIVPTLNNAIFAELADSFSRQLGSHERTMLIACNNYDLDSEVDIVRSLLERRIDGIALIGHDHTDTALHMLSVRDIPVLSLWNYRKNAELSTIGASNAEAGELATKHLLDLGHEQIAFMCSDTAINDRSRDRKMSALATMKQHDITVSDDMILDCPYNTGIAKTIATALIQQQQPTAIFCGNDVIAHGVVYAALALGIKIPEQLSVTGIGDFANSADMVPSLTTVRLPAKRIGQLAADTIVAMSMARNQLPTTHSRLDCNLIVRESTCAVRANLIQQQLT